MPKTAIAVFAYKRPYHLLRVLRALYAQPLTNSLDVYIFADGCKNDNDEEPVGLVLSIAEHFQSTRNCVVKKSLRNNGLRNSIVAGISELFETYEQLIVVEDDILTSPHFIDYMLSGLEAYSSNPKVASIHGYLPPIKDPMPETFFMRGADCWGWATWREKWTYLSLDAANMYSEICQKGLAKEFNLDGKVPNLELLYNTSEGVVESWAICWHASCFLKDMYTLHPGRSLVKNIGLDNSGEHCGPSLAMDSEFTLEPVRISLQQVGETSAVISRFAQQLAQPSLPAAGITTRVTKVVNPLMRLMRSWLIRLIKPASHLRLKGSYESYQEALCFSSGYDQPTIVDKVAKGVEHVLQGTSLYERDGTTFNDRPKELDIYSLLKQHIQDTDIIVDFGGGLGGLYINFPEIFPPSSRYVVVECHQMASKGRTLASKYRLPIEFYDSSPTFDLKSDIIIFSSVLQYVPDPWKVLTQWVSLHKPRLILIDRTVFSDTADSSNWSLQDNGDYYDHPVSYPIHLLSFERLVAELHGYRLQKKWLNRFDARKPNHLGLAFLRED